ncbi:MAG: aldo/keto reductase [Candidatus Bathyarchaeia archaeon]
MKYKSLGKTGVKVSELCLGTMIFGRQVDEASSIKIIKRAVDAGVNFIDTANVYAEGRSEEIVGKAIDGMRESIVLATKVRGRMGLGPNDEGLSRKHIMRSVEASLKRLGTDHIDLYQVHRTDPTTPLRETLTALNDLVRAGKVHYIGCSNFPAWQVEKALWISDVNGLESFVTVQPRYNVIDREVERELLPLCVEEGLGVIPYSPLAGGFLTGKYQPGRPPPEGTRFQLRPEWLSQSFTPRNQAVLQELEKLSKETGMTMGQLSLAWLLANPAVTSPIIGASKLEQLEENLQVVDRPLPVEALNRISEVSKPDWLREQEEREARMRAFREREQRPWTATAT